MVELIPMIFAIMGALAFILIVRHDRKADEVRIMEIRKRNILLSSKTKSKHPVDKF